MARMMAEINDLIGILLIEAGEDNPNQDVISTSTAVQELALRSEWADKEQCNYNILLKKIDITGKLYAEYSLKWKKITTTEVDPDTLLLLSLLIIREIADLLDGSGDLVQAMRRFNTLFKLIDIYPDDLLRRQSKTVGDFIGTAWDDQAKRALAHVRSVGQAVPTPVSNKGTEKSIPLTVLFYEGPIARAYLETIRSLGLRPERIVQLVSKRDLITRKPIGSWMPKRMRSFYLDSVQKIKIHYWAKTISSEHGKFVDDIHHSISNTFGFPIEIQQYYRSLESLSNYTDHVEQILINKLGDDELYEALVTQRRTTILYTGGGIVPKSLLTIPNVKFLHVHPGFLPEIRGADCALWSILTTGVPSASCFYMAPGIDDGDVVKALWLPEFRIESTSIHDDPQTLYRSVYCYIDSWIRAFTLREVLLENDDFHDMGCTPQDQNDGVMYHFTHAKVRQLALKKIFLS